jgi:glucan endo-1,3-alpha-glucosidase
MNSLPCATVDDGKYIINNFIAPFRSHPNQYLYNSKMFLSTFAGQWCTFGQASSPAGWQWLINNAGTPIYFIPNLQIGDATQLSTTWNFIDGFSRCIHQKTLHLLTILDRIVERLAKDRGG